MSADLSSSAKRGIVQLLDWANWGMVSATSTNLSAIEIHDAASPGIVGATEMLQKLLLAEIAQDRNFPAGVGLVDFGQLVKRETHHAYACPAAPHAGQHLALRPSRLAENATHSQ